jgi:hypothetical protein
MALDSKILAAIPSGIVKTAYDSASLESAINATQLISAPRALQVALNDTNYRNLVVSLIKIFNRAANIKTVADQSNYDSILAPRIVETAQVLDTFYKELIKKLQSDGTPLSGLFKSIYKSASKIVGPASSFVLKIFSKKAAPALISGITSLLLAAWVMSAIRGATSGNLDALDKDKKARLADLEDRFRRRVVNQEQRDAEYKQIMDDYKPISSLMDTLVKVAIIGGLGYFALAILPKIVTSWAGAAGAVKAVKGGEAPARGARPALPAPGYGYPAPQRQQSDNGYGPPPAPIPTPKKRPKTPPAVFKNRMKTSKKAKAGDPRFNGF